MLVQDADGVDPSTIVLQVEGVSYTIYDTELSYSNDTLYYYPANAFLDGDTINVHLLEAADWLGNPLEQEIEWSFIMDMTSPWSILVNPLAEMVRDRQQDIIVTVGDSLSGVDPNSIIIWVNDVQYNWGDYEWTAYDSIRGGTVHFIPEHFDIKFPPGDSVCMRIFITDTTDYCIDNEYDTIYCFLVEPEVACLVHPNPFTPNGDEINKFTVFDYPHMFSESAQLQIYNLRNVLVYERKIEMIANISTFEDRNWDGRDNSGNPLPAGLYIWLIIKNGEVVCNGTIVIAK